MFINKIIYTFRAIRNVWDFIFEFLHLKNGGDIKYHLTPGSTMLARAGTTDSAELIIINSDLEYPKKYFIYDRNHCVIFDIGANIGAFSIYYNSQVNNQTHKIYAIEPSKNNFKYLKKNIILNKAKNIICSRVAIASRNYIAKLDISKNVDSYALVRNKMDFRHSKIENVKARTIETFCRDNRIDNIDIMKIDIEGSEFEVFKKSIAFIMKHVRLIFVEVHQLNPHENIKIFSENMIRHNFRIVEIVMGRTLVLQNMNI